MFKLIKKLFFDNNPILLHFISIILIVFLSYYCSTWFHITIDIFNFSIDLNYILILIIIIFIIIIYIKLKNKRLNEFYILIFWTCSIGIIALFYFIYIQCFLLSIENVTDYISFAKFIKIRIHHTLNYKAIFFSKYYETYINKLKKDNIISEEQYSFLIEFIQIIHVQNFIDMSVV